MKKIIYLVFLSLISLTAFAVEEASADKEKCEAGVDSERLVQCVVGDVFDGNKCKLSSSQSVDPSTKKVIQK